MSFVTQSLKSRGFNYCMHFDVAQRFRTIFSEKYIKTKKNKYSSKIIT